MGNQPKLNYNRMDRGFGLPYDGTEAGTVVSGGTQTVVDLGRTVSNGLRMQTNDATGRVIFQVAGAVAPVPAGRWVAFLVEVIDFDLSATSGATASNGPIKFGTAAADGHTYVSRDMLKSGGVGWYCVTAQFAANTTPVVRVGLGTDGPLGVDVWMTIGRVGYFVMDESVETIPDYALPGLSAAYSTERNTVDAYNRVIFNETAINNLYPDNTVFYVIGDSKQNDSNESAYQLSETYGLAVYRYAQSGQGYDFISNNMSHLQSFKENFQGVTNDDIWSTMDESPQAPIRPNTVVFLNFGVNDIGTYTPTQMIENIEDIVNRIGLESVVVTEINPWKAGGAGSPDSGTSDAQNLADTLIYNSLLKSTARIKNWLFVPLYNKLGKALPNDAAILADGADSDPDYSVDGLHLSPLGSIIVSGLIYSELHLYRQKGGVN